MKEDLLGDDIPDYCKGCIVLLEKKLKYEKLRTKLESILRDEHHDISDEAPIDKLLIKDVKNLGIARELQKELRRISREIFSNLGSTALFGLCDIDSTRQRSDEQLSAS